MADYARLLRIRALQEKVAGDALVELRAALRRSGGRLDQLRASGQAAHSARLRKLLTGDRSGSISEEQTWHQLQASAQWLRVRLEQQREQEAALAPAYAAARGERRKLEILADAETQAARERERRQQQRLLDDAYLERRKRKPL